MGIVLRLLLCGVFLIPLSLRAEDANLSGENSLERSKLVRAQELVQEERQAKERGELSPAKSPGGIGMTMVSGLCVSLGVLCLLVFVAKKMQRGGFGTKGSKIKILERVPLGGKSILALVEVEGKRLLLSYGSDQVTLLQQERPQFSLDVEAAEVHEGTQA